jgi:regulator of replication initiation timing
MKIPDLDKQSMEDLKKLIYGLLEEVARLKEENKGLRDELNRWKKLKGRPNIKPSVASKPSGMEEGTNAKKKRRRKKSQRRGRRPIEYEDRIISLPLEGIPAGSVFKGYAPFHVQDLVIKVHATRYLRAQWETPEGRTILAPLPGHITDHFGAELKRFILFQYHGGQTTIPRLVQMLSDIGLPISKRQVVRILIDDRLSLRDEALDVLRAGLQSSPWVAADDTGARHKGHNGYCTIINNDSFAFYATTDTKSRLNFLTLLQAGETRYVLNKAAFDYMRRRKLHRDIIRRLKSHSARTFTDIKLWQKHLKGLGILNLKGTPEPQLVVTEGALWGSVVAQGFLKGSVILSDDAGQFNIGIHALCWVHAERLVYKLNAFTTKDQKAQEKVRKDIWALYRTLKVYRKNPKIYDKAKLAKRFDGIFQKTTGFDILDGLLTRLYANKEELLRVLDYPIIPLHNNGSENDARLEATRRKVSAGTRSDKGRDARNTHLSLMRTCLKQDITYWDFLGNRFQIPGAPYIPYLPALVAAHHAQPP